MNDFKSSVTTAQISQASAVSVLLKKRHKGLTLRKTAILDVGEIQAVFLISPEMDNNISFFCLRVIISDSDVIGQFWSWPHRAMGSDEATLTSKKNAYIM